MRGRAVEEELEELELENLEGDILEAELEELEDDDELEAWAARMELHLAKAQRCADRIKRLIQEL